MTENIENIIQENDNKENNIVITSDPIHILTNQEFEDNNNETVQ